MWSASVDPGRELLQMAFGGCVSPAEAADCAKRLRELLKQLQPGFTLLTDLSGVEEMDLACEPLIGGLMDDLNRGGIRKVIRVVPEPRKDIGFGIMAMFHYRKNVRVITCKSLKEAQTHLR